MMLLFFKKASVSDKTFNQEHVVQIFKLSVSEFKLQSPYNLSCCCCYKIFGVMFLENLSQKITYMKVLIIKTERSYLTDNFQLQISFFQRN